MVTSKEKKTQKVKTIFLPNRLEYKKALSMMTKICDYKINI